MNKKEEIIEAEKWYSASEICQHNFLPMLQSPFLIKKWIESGRLKGNVIGKGLSRRYAIKGANIIRFKAKFEAGDFH